jgi:Holliday junction resolvase RusA-like endonuclease
MEMIATIPLTAGFGVVSINRLYANRKQGGRVLTTPGRAYKRRTINDLIISWGLNKPPDPEREYKLTLHFYFPAVFSKGYPKTAQHKFRRIDQSNFVKFFQDCIVAASGIDDANHTCMEVTKREDAENPRVEVILEEWSWPTT